jgi:hypothetical protein
VLLRLSFLWSYGVFHCSVSLRVIIVFRDIIYVIIILYSWHLDICEHFWPYVWNNWSWVMHTMGTWFWHKNWVWQQFDHFFLIFFLQREVNCKCDNTDNNENATKICQELNSRDSSTRVHNLSRFKGSLPLWKMQQKYVKNSTVEILPLECTTYRGLKGHFPCDPLPHFHIRPPLATFTLLWVRVSNKKETINAF